MQTEHGKNLQTTLRKGSGQPAASNPEPAWYEAIVLTIVPPFHPIRRYIQMIHLCVLRM